MKPRINNVAADLPLGSAVLAAAVLAKGRGVDAFAEVLFELGGAREITVPRRDRDDDLPLRRRETVDPQDPRPQKRTAPILGTSAETESGTTQPPRRPEKDDVDLVKRHLERSRAFRGDDTRWLAKGEELPERPIHFPLITPNTFAAILGALGRQPLKTSALDTRRLVDTIARRKALKRLPTKIRHGLGSEVVVIRDLGPGMIPFQPDIDDFVLRTRRQLGRDKVRDDVRIEHEGSLTRVDTIGANSTIVIVSDLQGFARQYTYGHTKPEDWRKLARRIRATQSRALVLSPGTPAGQVPAPGFPDLFDGRRPRVAPIVPWDTSLTARHAATYVKRERIAVHRRPARDIAESRSSAYRLLRLLTLAQDVDHWTLRTLRLVLSAPPMIVRKYAAEIDDAHPLKRWKADPALKAFDPKAGAFHEHEVWTSAYLAYRGNVGTLSGKIDELRETPPSDTSEEWDKVVHFAREALLRVRAGRGLIQLVGDHRRWATLPDRLDRAAADADLRESQLVAEAIARLDGSPQRLGQIDRSLRIDPVVRADARKRVPQLTLRKQQESLIVDLDMPRADLRIDLREGFHLQTGTLELWPAENADHPAITRPLWPLRLYIPLERKNEAPLRTVVIRLGSDVVSINLDASLAQMAPLFTRVMPEQAPSNDLERDPLGWLRGDLRFEGNEIVCRGRRYDPLGLRDAGEAAPIVKPDELPGDYRSISVAPLNVWMPKDEGALYVQRVAGSGEISCIDLPSLPSRDRPQSAAGQNGHVVAFNWHRVWTVKSKEDKATVLAWDVSGGQRFRLAAASAAGGLFLSGEPQLPSLFGSGSRRPRPRFHFFPAEPESTHAAGSRPDGDANAGVISVSVPGDPDAIAMNDAGFIAVRDGSTLSLYEPIAGLGPGQRGMGANLKAATEGADKSTLTVKVLGPPYKRTWFPAKEYDVRSTIEALLSEDTDTLTRLDRAIRRNVRLPARDVELATGLAPAQAEMISAIFALDAAAINASTVPADFQLPGSGASLLQLACVHQAPGDIVPALLARGADPNLGDRFGRTPLHSAAFTQDGGLTMTRLLDAGADPSRTGSVNGIPVGPLAPALFRIRSAEDPKSPTRAVSREIIERLIDGGADAKAFSGSDQQSCLINAAVRGDDELFRRILTLDDRVNHIDKKDWCPLRSAAWEGNEGIARILIDHGAFIDLAGESGVTPLINAANRGHAAVVDLLLRHGANVDGATTNSDGAPLNPLDYALHYPQGPVTPEQSAAVVRVLAQAGANPDEAPFPFRDLLLFTTIEKRIEAAVGAFADAGRPLRLLETIKHHGANGLHGETLRRLLQLPLDFEAKDPAGLGLVHLLAMLWSPAKEEKAKEANEPFDPFEVLRDRNVSLQALDDRGWSALHYAAAAGNAEACRALQRAAPALTEVRRADRLAPADLAELFGHDALVEQLGGVSAWNGQVPAPRVPLAATMSRLTFLTFDAPWQTHVPTPPARRGAGVKVDVESPLPASITPAWTSVLTREAPLPYKSGRKLRETWWRRADDVVGVSGTVLNADGTAIFEIDGQSPGIHAMNLDEPPALDTPADALRYLKFFCQAVHGEQGHFALLETNEVFQSHVGHAANRESETFEHKGPVITAEADGVWRITAIVRYSNALFEAEFRVMPTGRIEMVSDRPLGGKPAPGEHFTNDSKRIFFYVKDS